jgi:hypothetical protein
MKLVWESEIPAGNNAQNPFVSNVKSLQGKKKKMVSSKSMKNNAKKSWNRSWVWLASVEPRGSP